MFYLATDGTPYNGSLPTQGLTAGVQQQQQQQQQRQDSCPFVCHQIHMHSCKSIAMPHKWTARHWLELFMWLQ